ncbi:hypothetical protein CEXT_507291 [Caerostris extrusa]|uniref:Uncharacterized protein n=1 Tax=Caerostris extrusa TaxID=172846 RepID=A0AAV4M847_CAEEX|nr:hypothetical protein CEXT_507291 [Caerostris extrusa]
MYWQLFVLFPPSYASEPNILFRWKKNPCPRYSEGKGKCSMRIDVDAITVNRKCPSRRGKGERNFFTPFLSESDLSKQVSGSPDTGVCPLPEGPRAVFPQRGISCCTDLSRRNELAAIRFNPTPARIFYFLGRKSLPAL